MEQNPNTTGTQTFAGTYRFDYNFTNSNPARSGSFTARIATNGAIAPTVFSVGNSVTKIFSGNVSSTGQLIGSIDDYVGEPDLVLTSLVIQNGALHGSSRLQDTDHVTGDLEFTGTLALTRVTVAAGIGTAFAGNYSANLLFTKGPNAGQRVKRTFRVNTNGTIIETTLGDNPGQSH